MSGTHTLRGCASWRRDAGTGASGFGVRCFDEKRIIAPILGPADETDEQQHQVPREKGRHRHPTLLLAYVARCADAAAAGAGVRVIGAGAVGVDGGVTGGTTVIGGRPVVFGTRFTTFQPASSG
jgi:hypothetical protein